MDTRFLEADVPAVDRFERLESHALVEGNCCPTVDCCELGVASGVEDRLVTVVEQIDVDASVVVLAPGIVVLYDQMAVVVALVVVVVVELIVVVELVVVLAELVVVVELVEVEMFVVEAEPLVTAAVRSVFVVVDKLLVEVEVVFELGVVEQVSVAAAVDSLEVVEVAEMEEP